jgi:hypothetical protein
MLSEINFLSLSTIANNPQTIQESMIRQDKKGTLHVILHSTSYVVAGGNIEFVQTVICVKDH